MKLKKLQKVLLVLVANAAVLPLSTWARKLINEGGRHQGNHGRGAHGRSLTAAPECADYTCSDGWVPSPTHHLDRGASDVECCVKSCKLWRCSQGYKENPRYWGNVYQDDEQCCDKTCFFTKCDDGFIPKEPDTVGRTKEACCDVSCSDFTCSGNWTAIPDAETRHGASMAECCRPRCILFDCNISGWAFNPEVWSLSHDFSKEGCCTQECNSWTCPDGFRMPEAWAERVHASDEQCCNATCANYMCSSAHVRNDNVTTEFGSTDEECCLPECVLHTCNLSAGWTADPSKYGIVAPNSSGQDDATCCRRTCQVFNCSNGWVHKQENLQIGGESTEFCCEKTCALFTCDHDAGWLTDGTKNTTVGFNATSCCQPTCLLHNCSEGWIKNDGKVNSCAHVSHGDRFLQLGEWRLGDVYGDYFSIAHKNGSTAQLYASDGMKYPGPRTDYSTWARPSDSDLQSSSIFFGDRFIQIGNWRLGDADGIHFTIGHKDGIILQLWRQDGNVFDGPQTYSYSTWSRPFQEELSGVSFGDGFIQIGEWRIGEVSGQLLITHKDGITAQVFRLDGPHAGPQRDDSIYKRQSQNCVFGQKAVDEGISDEKCCAKLCSSYVCDASNHWLTDMSKTASVGNDDVTCCQRSCAAHKCNKGWVLDSSKSTTPGNTDDQCCLPTCLVHTCAAVPAVVPPAPPPITWEEAPAGKIPLGADGEPIKGATFSNKSADECKALCSQDPGAFAIGTVGGSNPVCTCYTTDFSLSMYESADKNKAVNVQIASWSKDQADFQGYTSSEALPHFHECTPIVTKRGEICTDAKLVASGLTNATECMRTIKTFCRDCIHFAFRSSDNACFTGGPDNPECKNWELPDDEDGEPSHVNIYRMCQDSADVAPVMHQSKASYLLDVISGCPENDGDGADCSLWFNKGCADKDASDCPNEDRQSPYVLHLPADVRAGDAWLARDVCKDGVCNAWVVFDFGKEIAVNYINLLNFEGTRGAKKLNFWTSLSLDGPWELAQTFTDELSSGNGDMGTIAEKVVAPVEAYCQQGIVANSHPACCPAICGKCGGQGCELAPGGREYCCVEDWVRPCQDKDDLQCLISGVISQAATRTSCLQHGPCQIDDRTLCLRRMQTRQDGLPDRCVWIGDSGPWGSAPCQAESQMLNFPNVTYPAPPSCQATAATIIAEVAKNDAICAGAGGSEGDGNDVVFKLTGSNATEEACTQKCLDVDACVAYSGIFGVVCAGCKKQALTERYRGALAFTKVQEVDQVIPDQRLDFDPPAVARYVKMNILENHGSTDIGLLRVFFYGHEVTTGKFTCEGPLENLAVGKTAYANSWFGGVLEGHYVGRAPIDAFDRHEVYNHDKGWLNGCTGKGEVEVCPEDVSRDPAGCLAARTNWTPGLPKPHVEVDMGAPVWVGRLRAVNYEDTGTEGDITGSRRTQSWSLMASEDGKTYAVVAEGNAQDKPRWHTTIGGGAFGRFFRFVIEDPGAGTNKCQGLMELELWGHAKCRHEDANVKRPGVNDDGKSIAGEEVCCESWKCEDWRRKYEATHDCGNVTMTLNAICDQFYEVAVNHTTGFADFTRCKFSTVNSEVVACVPSNLMLPACTTEVLKHA